MPKLVLEIKKPLRNNDILIYKDGEFVPTDVNVLFINFIIDIRKLKDRCEALENEVKEQKRMIEKNAHDILVDRGIEDE